MNIGRNLKVGMVTFCVTLCVLATAGGLIAVNEISYQLKHGERKVETPKQEETKISRMVLYLPPQWQALLIIPKWQSKWWEYYFTLIKTP